MEGRAARTVAADGTGSQAESSYRWDTGAREGHFVVAAPDGLHRHGTPASMAGTGSEADDNGPSAAARHFGGLPGAGRIGAIGVLGWRRGPDHRAGTASTDAATA